jgi:hypothetical protein
MINKEIFLETPTYLKKKRFTAIVATIFCQVFKEFKIDGTFTDASDQKFYHYLIDCNLISYFKFQREKIKEEKEHWQMHVIFKKQLY